MGNYGGRETYAEWRAQLPDCLMALYADPDPRGRVDWLSPIHVGAEGWPQVSSVPRNFSVEPASWRDLEILQQQVEINDNASFYIDFDWHYDGAPPSTASIESGAGTGVIGGYIAGASGSLTAHTNMLGSGSDYAYIDLRASGNPLARGRHVIQCRVSGTTFYARLDDEPEKSVSKVRATGRTFSVPTSNADMYIYDSWLRNDTTGKTVWSYPSFAERTRLIKAMDNVLTGNTGFEGATMGRVRRVKTALDLRECITPITIFGRFFVPSHVPDGNLYASGLVTQGNYLSGTGLQTVIDFSLWEDYRTTATKRLHVMYSDGGVTMRGPIIDVSSLNIFDRWIVLAAVFDRAAGKIRTYLDGVNIREASFLDVPFGSGAGSSLSDAVSILHDPYVAYGSGHKADFVHLYNSVFQGWEIALMSAA